jgi:hypothetical protein
LFNLGKLPHDYIPSEKRGEIRGRPMEYHINGHVTFFEYLQIKIIPGPPIPAVSSLSHLFRWTPDRFNRVGEEARPLAGHFHDYLLRGGFPQCALVPTVDLAQKLLREDIVDKVLKRDMTALSGNRSGSRIGRATLNNMKNFCGYSRNKAVKRPGNISPPVK